VAERPMSKTRTIPKESKDITIVDIINMIQEIPKQFVGTKEGVAFVSLLSGILLEQAGFSDSKYRIKEKFRDPGEKFLWSEEKDSKGVVIGLVPFHGNDENKACLAMESNTRVRVCDLKPKLNVEFDIWPWSSLAIPKEFGKFDLPVPKLLIILGTMGMSAEFLKGMGGVIPG